VTGVGLIAGALRRAESTHTLILETLPKGWMRNTRNARNVAACDVPRQLAALAPMVFRAMLQPSGSFRTIMV
jgi:hypothetical protein